MTSHPIVTAMVLAASSTSIAAELQLLHQRPDPYGFPRPAPGATSVPVRTSFFLQVGFEKDAAGDAVLVESLEVRLHPPEGGAIELLRRGGEFGEGYTGRIIPGGDRGAAVAVYLEGREPLQPGANYRVTVEARSRQGAVLSDRASWDFTTAADEAGEPLEFSLDFSAQPVLWGGGFFTGFCKPSFCTSASNRIPGYRLMDRIRQQSPRAWSLQRDFAPTSMAHQPGFLESSAPNVVRERETRRITAIEPRNEGMLLQLEDFFGHEQYGIPSGRSLAEDYHPGDEVLIADGVSDARAHVVRVIVDSPEERSLLVTSFEQPPDGWKIDYARPLPTEEDPQAPGLFPPGGCYLRKFHPAGTPHFYWGRIDREWDIACRQFGRRLVVNFADAPGDLAVDGRSWTYPKDYAEYHQVVREYTSHLIDRYGDACLDFVWSVCNEPDLASAFWRSGNWDELQRFYDYTVDGVLRSFEDHGYDSGRVMVGGLEIGAIFGTHIEGPILKKFLFHCSPVASGESALEENAAFADARLDGKRSRRVESLCRAHDGKGSPCDFISVHAYNAAPVMAAKLQRARQLALEIDADSFARLWVSSFESCPNWAPPPDVAAADSYLGNGYFSTWCADVTRRLLASAANGGGHGFGETILTFWPWPNSNFGGHNNATQVISVDEDGDGLPDREETIPLPILNFLGLLARMSDRYWVLPERTVGGHVVSGFASRQDHRAYLLIYSHDPADIQSRAASEFTVNLELAGLPPRELLVTEYRFDQEHNSYYHPARELRDRRDQSAAASELTDQQLKEILDGLSSDDPGHQRSAVQTMIRLSQLPESLLMATLQLYQSTEDEGLKAAIEIAGQKLLKGKRNFAAHEVARIKELAELRATDQNTCQSNGALRLSLTVAGNGANFVVIEPGRTP